MAVKPKSITPAGYDEMKITQVLKEKKVVKVDTGADMAMLKGRLYGCLFNHVEAISLMEDVLRQQTTLVTHHLTHSGLARKR